MPAGDFEITITVLVTRKGEHYWDTKTTYTKAQKQQVTGVQKRLAESGVALVNDGILADEAKPKKNQ